MKHYQVVITYRLGQLIGGYVESVHNCEAMSKTSAKAQAKRALNQQGVFGTFSYKVYGGHPDKAIDALF